MNTIRKAILPVAGLGTRILPATKAIPKEMLPVHDRPLVQWAVEEAIDAGIEEIILVTSRGKQAIEDHFDRNEALETTLERRGKLKELAAAKPILPTHAIKAVRQHAPLGLGHAVLCGKDLIGDEAFAVLLPDDFCRGKIGVLKQLVAAWEAQGGGSVIALQAVPRSDTGKYGIAAGSMLDGRTMRVIELVEKPDPASAPSNLAVIGRYIIDPAVMRALETTGKGAGGEIQLTDAIAAQCASGNVYGYAFEGERWDCGSREGWLLANLAVAMENPVEAARLRAAIEPSTIQKAA